MNLIRCVTQALGHPGIATTMRILPHLLSTIILVTGCSRHESQSDLFERAQKTQNMSEFQQCCGKIQDQKLLGKLVLNGDVWGKRRTALDYVTDVDILSNIAATSSDFDIKIYGKQRLDVLKSGGSLDSVPTTHWSEVQKDGTIK